jgi:hypothetical protein
MPDDRLGFTSDVLSQRHARPLCPNSRLIAVWQQTTLRAISRHRARSFDHLVGELLEILRHIEADRLCGLEIDHQLELCRELDWQLTRLGALQNLVNEVGGALIVCWLIDAIAD